MQKFFKKLESDSGFTLVELMVVVAIIGILSAVAIPNFKSYQAKAKTAEAKLQLTSIYQAEAALQADYDSFAVCLKFAGYSGPSDANYYAVGFTGTGGSATVVANGGTNCANDTGENQIYWFGKKNVGGKIANQTSYLTAIAATGYPDTPATVNTAGSSFLASAAGPIEASKAATEFSEFTINENKALKEWKKGY